MDVDPHGFEQILRSAGGSHGDCLRAVRYRYDYRGGTRAARYCCWVCPAGFTPLVTPTPCLAT